MLLPKNYSKVSLIRLLIIIVCLGVFVSFFPLIKFVSLHDKQGATASESFSANKLVEDVWNGPLVHAKEKSLALTVLLKSMAENPAAAAEKHGHKLGVNSSSSYFVSGKGHIVSAIDGVISIALDGAENTLITVEQGPVFGNVIRDGSGLFNVSDYANTQDFNDISAELNRRVEERVLANLFEKVKVGDELFFVGGLEVSDSEVDLSKLTLVPVEIKLL